MPSYDSPDWDWGRGCCAKHPGQELPCRPCIDAGRAGPLPPQEELDTSNVGVVALLSQELPDFEAAPPPKFATGERVSTPYGCGMVCSVIAAQFVASGDALYRVAIDGLGGLEWDVYEGQMVSIQPAAPARASNDFCARHGFPLPCWRCGVPTEPSEPTVKAVPVPARPKLTIGYCRVATEEQADGASIEAQIAAVEARLRALPHIEPGQVVTARQLNERFDLVNERHRLMDMLCPAEDPAVAREMMTGIPPARGPAPVNDGSFLSRLRVIPVEEYDSYRRLVRVIRERLDTWRSRLAKCDDSTQAFHGVAELETIIKLAGMGDA